jgi:large subunit ribosomal protein L6
MSRIGKKPIEIPEVVKVEITPAHAGGGQDLKVSGPKGELCMKVHEEIIVESKDGKILVAPKTELSKKGRVLWGLYRALIANMVVGVSKGFEKKLEIEGVGFKATVEADNLVLNVGFTNPVRIKKPEGITFLVEKNVITVSGISKETVGHIAALIRKSKKAEPYKGKGIKYQGEKIRRKEGKKVVASK